jgi:Cdc6-like AAA superfamily ATPase
LQFTGEISLNNHIFQSQCRNYNKFGLRANPFPYAGVPDDVPKIYVGQDEALLAINSVLSTTILTGRANHLILTGTYGNGKSHTLKYIHSQISTKSSAFDRRPCTAYIAQPGETFLDIYRDFIYDLGLNFIQKRAQEYIGKVAVDLVEQGIIKGPIDPADGWQSVEDGDILLSEIVPHAFTSLSKHICFPDFARAFINMAYEENSLTSWEWLSGEPIEYTRRREMSIASNIDRRHASRAFNALKKTLETLRYAPTIMLVDEFEHIENFPVRTKQEVLNSFRHLIDMNPTDFSLIIACAPEVWGDMMSEYHAFSERIGREANLKPLTTETVKSLIVSYLNSERITPKMTPEPFTDESIEQIFKLGDGNTRRIITLCSQSMDLCIDSDCEIIDSKVLQKVTR